MPQIFDRSSETFHDPSAARWAAAAAAFLMAVINFGHFATWHPETHEFAISLDDKAIITSLSLFILGPMYAWLFARLMKVQNLLQGVYVGLSLVALMQYLVTFLPGSAFLVGKP